jgi:hypothetical protein
MTMSRNWINDALRVSGILILLMLPALALATVTFERRWHWYRQNVGHSVALTANGGYLVGGETWVDTTEYGIVMARADSLGDTTSVRHLLYVGHGSGYLCGLKGGDFVAAGADGGSHLFARCYNAAGDSIWSYGPSLRGVVYALIATSDGGCVIAGRDSTLDMGAIRLDSSGNQVWAHGYDEPRVQGSMAYGVSQTRDGGFILCGDATDYMGSYVRLVRTDSAGDTLWTRLLSGPVGPSLRAICEMKDGGFLVAGTEFDTLQSQTAIYLLCTDSIGLTRWTRSISPAGAGTAAMAMCPTRDSGYMIAATIDWNDSSRVWLVKLKASADTSWTRALPGRGKDQAADVWQTADGGYLAVGTSDSAGGSVLLAKTDSTGYVAYGITESREEAATRLDLSVVPNPTNGTVKVEWPLPAGSEPATLRVYDSQGRLVHSSFVIRHSPFSLGLRSLPSGVYLLRLESGCGSATRKLVIE